MDDLRRRFATLDRLEVPDLWDEVRARASARPASVHGRVRWAGATLPRSAWILLLLLLLIAAIGAAVLIGPLTDGRPIAERSQSVEPSSVAVVPPPTPSVAVVAPVDGSPAPVCPAREAPLELRVVPIELPAFPVDVVERGCRVWIQLGANGAGIARLGPELDGVDATIAPAEITTLARTSDPVLWAEAAPALTGPGDTAVIGRIDPADAHWEPVLRVPVNHMTTAIVGDVVWLRDVRSIHTWMTRVDASPGTEPLEISAPAGQLRAAFGSMWVFANEGAPRLERFDVATQRRVATIDVGTAVQCLETARGYVCVGADGRLIGISAATNAIEWSVTIPNATEPSLAVLGGAAWLQPTTIAPGRMDASELIEVDLATGGLVRRIPFPVRQPNGLWGAAGSLWITGADRDVVRVDLPTGG